MEASAAIIHGLKSRGNRYKRYVAEHHGPWPNNEIRYWDYLLGARSIFLIQSTGNDPIIRSKIRPIVSIIPKFPVFYVV